MNEPVPLSSFGIFTNECAELYCKDKDGLELWLSLVNDCFYNDNNDDNNSINDNNITNRMLLQTNSRLHSSMVVAMTCSLVALVCFVLSYTITKRLSNSIQAHKKYEKGNTIEHKNNKYIKEETDKD